MIDTKTFADRMRQARLAAGLNSQRDLSRASGIVPQTLSLYEKGATLPSVENLVKLSQVLHVSTDWLLGQTSEESVICRLESYADAIRLIQTLLDRFGESLADLTEATVTFTDDEHCNTTMVETENMRLTNSLIYPNAKTMAYKVLFMRLRYDERLQKYFTNLRTMNDLVVKHVITPEMRDSWETGELTKLETVKLEKAEEI